MNKLAKAYQTVRDETFKLPVAESLGMLELIKFELLRDTQAPVDKEIAKHE